MEHTFWEKSWIEIVMQDMSLHCLAPAEYCICCWESQPDDPVQPPVVPGSVATLYHYGLPLLLPPTSIFPLTILLISHSANCTEYYPFIIFNVQPSPFCSVCSFSLVCWYFSCLFVCLITERISGTSFWQFSWDFEDYTAGTTGKVLGEGTSNTG